MKMVELDYKKLEKMQCKNHLLTRVLKIVSDPSISEQERSAEIEAIRAALVAGEESGEPKVFNIAAFKQRMHSTYG